MSSVSIDLWGGMDALTNWLMDDVLGAFFNWLGLHGFADFLMSDTLGTVIMLLLIVSSSSLSDSLWISQ